MSLSRLRAAVLTAALFGPAATATAQSPAPCPPAPCPPGQVAPRTWTPGSPTTPGTPGTPTTPGAPATPDASAAPANTPAPSADSTASATASQGGAESGGSSLPGIFGDLFGGGAIRGPYLAQFDAQGRLIGQAPRVIVNGQSVSLAGTVRATDELLLGSAGQGTAPPGSRVASTRLIYNVDPRDAALLPVIPAYYRGTFKITENETPRPTTRAYFTYNYYDEVFASQGVNTPRIGLHQETFGYEQAFADRQYSVGVRLPYNQLVSPGYVGAAQIGDVTVVTKAVISENRATGDVLSGGLTVTAPTGSLPQSGVYGRTVPRDTLLQPYLGYLLTNGDLFLQGFTSVIVPTSSADVTLFAQSLAVGYTLYKRPGGALSAVYPVFEAHLTTPLNHRDFASGQDAVSLPDTLTLLTGTFFELNGRSTLGFAVGTPVTGPRPFSVQGTAQLSLRF